MSRSICEWVAWRLWRRKPDRGAEEGGVGVLILPTMSLMVSLAIEWCLRCVRLLPWSLRLGVEGEEPPPLLFDGAMMKRWYYIIVSEEINMQAKVSSHWWCWVLLWWRGTRSTWFVESRSCVDLACFRVKMCVTRSQEHTTRKMVMEPIKFRWVRALWYGTILRRPKESLHKSSYLFISTSQCSSDFLTEYFKNYVFFTCCSWFGDNISIPYS